MGLLYSFLNNAINVDTILSNYQKSIHSSLEKREEAPFSWNSIRYEHDPVKQKDNFRKDIIFYYELITYCVRFGNTKLLDYWGIQYLSQPNIRLAKHVNAYLEHFGKWIKDPTPFIKYGIDPKTVQPYIQYLIDHLSMFISKN